MHRRTDMQEHPREPAWPVNAAIGAAAGLGATAFMSVLMVGAEKAGLMGRQPPSTIAGRLLGSFGAPRSSERTDAVGGVIHYVIGGGLGIGFAMLRRLLPPFRRPTLGIVYALGVWALSYGGLLPGLGLMPPPERDRPGRQPVLVAGHVVFGLALGILTRRLAGAVAR